MLSSLHRRFFTTSRFQNSADFSHTIIGGGVVGLAIGAELAKQSPNNNVLIIEKNAEYGQETSSRNSEVVHAGIYYPVNSLKTKLCIEGKNFIYSQKDKIPTRECGKWIIAQTEEERSYLEKLHEKTKLIGVKTEFISIKQAKLAEPLIRANCAILNSPTTGITSAHGLMNYYYTIFQENDGSLALGTKVTDIEYNKGESLYEIATESEEEESDDFVIKSNNVINCAGLYAPDVTNMILKGENEKHVKAYYAKGNYFSYTGPDPHINRLIYPCPTPGVASLGTHLTIDLGGQVRFGPDLEWVDNCVDYKVNGKNLSKAVEQVQLYFPTVKKDQLSPSYSGIRPKLIGPGNKQFMDFVIREESGHPGFVSCLGIESPGLTSSYGIARHVVNSFFK